MAGVLLETFHFLIVQILFSSGWVADWLPFGEKLLTQLLSSYFDHLLF